MRLLQFLYELTTNKSADFDKTKKIYIGPKSFMVKFDSNRVPMAFIASVVDEIPKSKNSSDFFYIWDIKFGFRKGDNLITTSLEALYKEMEKVTGVKHKMSREEWELSKNIWGNIVECIHLMKQELKDTFNGFIFQAGDTFLMRLYLSAGFKRNVQNKTGFINKPGTNMYATEDVLKCIKN